MPKDVDMLFFTPFDSLAVTRMLYVPVSRIVLKDMFRSNCSHKLGEELSVVLLFMEIGPMAIVPLPYSIVRFTPLISNEPKGSVTLAMTLTVEGGVDAVVTLPPESYIMILWTLI